MMDKKIRETRESFDYQWANLKESPYLLSNAKFKEKCGEILLDELNLSKEDIVKKLVLDVGCGNGRWSYAFKKLGAKVVAYDFTKSGCRETRKLNVDVVIADALNPPFNPESFDIVFSFGVLHHTNSLEKAFEENAKLVKRGGLMHVYLYKKKHFILKIWRLFIRSIPNHKGREIMLSLFLKIRKFLPRFLKRLIPYSNLHGGFDALSPKTNIESEDAFVRKLFRENGFGEVNRIKTNWCDWKVDIHMRGVKE